MKLVEASGDFYLDLFSLTVGLAIGGVTAAVILYAILYLLDLRG